MLAYNYRKQNRTKSDPVREILARIEEKQSKTGLSLYNRGDTENCTLPTVDKTTGDEHPSSKIARSSFPDMKAARVKAQTRITTNLSNQQTCTAARYFGQKRTKRAPHRLPGSKVDSDLNQTFPPTSFRNAAMLAEDNLNSTYGNLPDYQFSKDNIDFNVNPFGYNRKTLAFDNRNVNYVVEWPETWPFKITSFQGRSKPVKTKHQRRHDFSYQLDMTSAPVSTPDEDGADMLLWQEPADRARVLAPVDLPGKRQPQQQKPFLESVKRQSKKPQSRNSKIQILQNCGKEADFTLKKSAARLTQKKERKNASDKDCEAEAKLHPLDPSADKAEESVNPTTDSSIDGELPAEETECAENDAALANQDPSNKVTKFAVQENQGTEERGASVPPSTPVAPMEERSSENEAEEKPHEEEAKAVLMDIVNQIIAEDDGPKII